VDTCTLPHCTQPLRARGWCAVHYMRWHAHGDPLAAPPSLVERIWRRIERSEGCWLWTGQINDHGYGLICRDDRPARAHRVVYELLVEPIPEGLVLDHLCRVRHCVNPAHLEVVTLAENTLRGEGPSARHARVTHCPQGHPYDEANTRRTRRGGRVCRTCHRDRERAARRVRNGRTSRG